MVRRKSVSVCKCILECPLVTFFPPSHREAAAVWMAVSDRPRGRGTMHSVAGCLSTTHTLQNAAEHPSRAREGSVAPPACGPSAGIAGSRDQDDVERLLLDPVLEKDMRAGGGGACHCGPDTERGAWGLRACQSRRERRSEENAPPQGQI